MNYKKDILLVDLEMTGLDPARHEIIQLSAILLDKKTLREKAFFNSYIKPKKWQNRDPESMKVNRLSLKTLNQAPALAEVLKQFAKKFRARQVVLANYGGIADITFLQAAYRKAKLKWPFDYHFFNLWPIFFQYLAEKNLLLNKRKFAGFGLEDLAKKFKIKSANRHDGLSDCRVEAEILRKIAKQN